MFPVSSLAYMDTPSLVPRTQQPLKNVCCVQDLMTALNQPSGTRDEFQLSIVSEACEGPTGERSSTPTPLTHTRWTVHTHTRWTVHTPPGCR